MKVHSLPGYVLYKSVDFLSHLAHARQILAVGAGQKERFVLY